MNRRRWILIGWGMLLAGGIAGRLWFLFHQPFTNDEGAYLYDAWVLSEGDLPAGDVLAKSPTAALLFLLGVSASGRALFAARGVALLLNLATVLPLVALVRRLAGPRAARAAAVL